MQTEVLNNSIVQETKLIRVCLASELLELVMIYNPAMKEPHIALVCVSKGYR